jgi:hypothetical protein
MKQLSSQTGRQEQQSSSSRSTAAELLASLTEQQHNYLIAFAAKRLQRLRGNAPWQRILACVAPEDCVNRSIEKVLLGDTHPKKGRTLAAHNRASLDAFLACLTGIINSDLSHLISSTEAQCEHVPVQTEAETSHGVELAEEWNPSVALELQDLKEALFSRLRQVVSKRQALCPIIDSWEASFLADHRIPNQGFDRRLVWEVRRLARDILTDLARELTPGAPTGMEMLL